MWKLFWNPGYVPNPKLLKKMKRLNGDLKCFINLFPFLVLKIGNVFKHLEVELKVSLDEKFVQ